MNHHRQIWTPSVQPEPQVHKRRRGEYKLDEVDIELPDNDSPWADDDNLGEHDGEGHSTLEESSS